MGFAEENKNYCLVGDKAYTEDDILIYNIFVFKIPITVKNEDILGYFTQFGEVVKVHLVSDKKRNRRKAPKVGFVHFADAKVAAKVLVKTHHVLHTKRIALKACDSWHQPGAYKSTNDNDVRGSKACAAEPDQSSLDSTDNVGACGPVPTTAQAPPPAPLNILDLNDDCLEHIAKKMDLRDQVRMARTCTRFHSVVQMCSKVEHKLVMLEKFSKMTLWEIREFFIMSGASVETITGVMPFRNRDRVIELIAANCLNVKSINLDTSKMKTNSLRKLIGSMKNITELQLHDCSLNDNAVLAIKKLPNLEIFTVSENYELTGKNLPQLTTVRELDIHGCGNIQSVHFVETIKAMKELQTLNVQRCERLLASAFDEMEKHCSKLETLRMSCPDISYHSVARLPALKRLELIAGGVPIRQSLFTALSEHKSSQLEYLKITARNAISLDRAIHISQLSKLKQLILASNDNLNDDCLRKFCALDQLEEIVLRSCTPITNVGLLNLMRRCTKLRRINIQRCPNINDQFVFDVIDLLRQRQEALPPNHKREPVIFFVLKTGISEFIMNNSKCQNISSLLKLSFYCPFNMYNTDEEDSMEIFDYLDDEDYDEFDDDDNESIQDDDIDFIVDIDNEVDPYEMYYDEIEMNEAYDMFGRYAPFDDIDHIW